MKKAEINKLDNLALKTCKEEAGNRCEICGKGKDEVQLHAHHVIGRRHRSLRWDVDNLVCLCATHHVMGKQSAHENPFWFDKEIVGMRGEAWKYNLEKKAQVICKTDYQTVKDYLDGKRDNYC